MNAAAVPTVDVSVLIVGAGPTGLTLACDLARRGVDFRIVEKAHSYLPGLAEKVCNHAAWKFWKIWES